MVTTASKSHNTATAKGHAAVASDASLGSVSISKSEITSSEGAPSLESGSQVAADSAEYSDPTESMPTIDANILLPAVKHIAAFRGGMRTHSGVFDGARVAYFRGKHALTSLSSMPPTKLGGAAPLAVLTALLREGFLMRVEKRSTTTSKARKLVPHDNQFDFDTAASYIVRYSVTSLTHIIGSVVLVVGVLAVFMFPLWPHWMRQGAVYLSYAILGVLALLFALGIVRIILYIPLRLVGYPGWLFPNLFADVGFFESFVPVWEWEPKTADKKSVHRESEEESGNEDLPEEKASNKARGKSVQRAETSATADSAQRQQLRSRK